MTHLTPPSQSHSHLLATGLQVSFTPAGLVNLLVRRDHAPVLVAQVDAQRDQPRLLAAHQVMAATPAELTALRDILLTLLPSTEVNLVMDTLPTAPQDGHDTPWGVALTCESVEPGVYYVITASHGGYWVDDAVLRRLPAAAQRPERWYEHDVQGALLAVSLRWGTDDPVVQAQLRAVLTQFAPELLSLLEPPT